jgi:hypothetical protein
VAGGSETHSRGRSPIEKTPASALTGAVSGGAAHWLRAEAGAHTEGSGCARGGEAKRW